MPVEFTSVLSADGAPAKKKGAQNSFDAMVEAEQALRDWQISQEKKKNPSGNITLPTWNTLKEAKQQAEEKKKVTYQKLNSAKKLADTREQQWNKLTSIYETKQKELESSQKELESFKYLANDYQEKIDKMEEFRSAFQINPSASTEQAYQAAAADVKRWENDHKRDLDTYSKLVEEYNTTVREYNRASESLNKYAPAAQRAVDTYTNMFDAYDWSSQEGLSNEVKEDYVKLVDSQKQALTEYKNQLQMQKTDLENQLRNSARSLLSGGNFFQNLQTQNDLKGQLDAINGDLQILEERESADKAEQEARSDPEFQKYADQGEKEIEDYYKASAWGNVDTTWYNQYKNMTDAQKQVFAYFMGKDKDSDRADSYRKSISREVNASIAKNMQTMTEQYAQEHPVLAGISSVLTTPYTSAQVLGEALAGLGDLDNAAVDPNTTGQRLMQAQNTYRQAGLDQIDNPVLRTLAEAGYSVADMAPALAANAVLPGLGTAYMGVLGGTSGYSDAVSRGLTQSQALTYGLTSGAVSTALEKVGLDKIGAAFAGGKKTGTQILRNILGSFVAEGSEEAAENAAQVIYDEIISGTKSARNQAVQQYMDQGMSRSEAEKRAWMDIGEDTLSSFIVGGLAGGALGGLGGGVSNVNQQLQSAGLTQEQAQTLIESQPRREYSLNQNQTPNNAESVQNVLQTAEDIGATAVMDDTLAPNESGYYDTQTREIHLNPNANVNTVFSHELTHSLENTNAYQKLKDLVLNRLGDEAETLRQEKIDLYQSQGKDLDVDAELVADYVSQNLFTDAESIRSLAQQDRSLATRIKNWITRMIAKVTGNDEKAFLMRAEDLYAQALQQNARSSASLMSTQAETQRESAQVQDASEESVKNYSLNRDVQKLQNQNNELRRQMTRSTKNEPNPTQVRSTARQLLDGYGSRMDRSALTNDLTNLYTFMATGSKEEGGRTVEASYETAKAQAMDIAGKILSRSETVDSSTRTDYQNIKAILRDNPVNIPQEIRSNIAGGYADYMRRHRGELNVKSDGSSVEDLWATLEENYPALFDSEQYPNPSDMIERIGDVLDSLKPGSSYNPFETGEADLQQEQEQLANDIMERFFEIPQRAPTFADKQAAKLTRERIRSRKALDAEKERSAARVRKVKETERVKRVALKKAGDERVKQAKEQERKKSSEKVASLKEKQQLQLKQVRVDRDQKLTQLRQQQRETEAKARDRRNRRETREKILRHVKELSNKVLHPTDKKHIPDELTGPVAALLDAVNLESSFDTALDAEGRLRRTAVGEGEPTKRTQAFRELREAYSKIMKDSRWSNELVVDPDLEANIDAVVAMKDIRLQDMTQEQLATVWNTVRAVELSVSTANQLFADERYKSVAELGDSVRRGLDSQREKTERTGAVGKIGRLFNVDMLNPWDYFHEWGSGGETIYKFFRNAQDQQIRDIEAMQDFMADFDSKKIKKWMEGESREFRVEGGTIKLTTAQKMSLYLLMKREQAKNHILRGGIKQGTVRGKRGKIEKSSRPVTVTEDDVKMIVDTLTDEQKRAADRLGKFMSTTMSQWGNETSMKLYGYQKFTEENYFPIRSDSNYVARVFGKEVGQGSIANKGFTKALTENASNPVVIEDVFSEFARHGAEMAAYHSFLPALEDAGRVYNYKPAGVGYQGSVSEALERALGTAGKDYFANFIQDINGRANLRNDFDVGSLLSNYKRAAVGANLRVVIQQPTSYFRAAAVLSPKYLTKGVFTPRKWNIVKEYAPIAQWKDWGYFEINTGRQLEDVILGTDSNFEKAQQGLMALAGKADEITWTRLWSACEYWVKDHHKDLTPDTPEFYRAVNDKFSEVIDRTQVVDSVLHRSQIMRSNTGLNKMATSFMGEPTKTYNLLRTAVRDYAKAPKGQKAAAGKRMVGAMSAFLVSGTVNAAAAALIDALRDDDRGEDYLEKWSQAFTGLQGDEENVGDYLANLFSGNLADNLNVLNMVPYVKDLLSIAQGFTVERMDMSSVADFYKTAERLIKSINGESASSVLKNSTDLILQFAKVMGVPAANIARDFGAVTQTVIGALNDPVIDYYYNQINAPLSKNKGMYYDIMYEALAQENTDAYNTIRDNMLDRGVTLGDIRTAMRDRFKEAWEEDPSLASNKALMEAAGVDDDTIADWKLNDFKNKWLEDPRIADDTDAMAAAGVTQDNIKAWEETQWKESGYLEELKALGADTSTVEQVVNKIKNASNSAGKREAIRNANLTNEQKAVLYRTIASETDRGILDSYRENGGDVGEVYRLLDGMASYSRTQDKLNVLSNSTLSDSQLQQLMEEKIFQEGSSRPETLSKMLQTGLTVKDFIAVYNQWSELDNSDLKATEAQTEFSKWLDQNGFDEQQQIIIKDGFGFYSQIRAGETKYDRFGNAGLSSDVAASMEEMLSDLVPEAGSDSVSATQQAVAISQGDYSDEDKMKALSVVMQDSSYAKVQAAYEQGISPSAYVQYWSDIKKISGDKDANGKSISGSKKSKVLTYINSLDLTTEQKDYLYEENGYAASTLGEAPWYGGSSYEGTLFDEELSGVDGENVWAAASEVVEDAYSKITQRYGVNGHGGTDIGWSISPTEPIYSAGDGTVVEVQTGYGNAPGSQGNASYGNYVKIQHADGTYTLYAHLSSVNVAQGDTVKGGEQIGNMGNTGNSYGNHLHFEVRDSNNQRMDSTAFLEGDLNPSSGGTPGTGETGGSSPNSSGGSSGRKPSGSSTKKTSGYQALSFSPTVSGTSTRTVPKAQAVSRSNVRKISMPTVKSISKTAISGGSGVSSVSSVGQIESRNSRETADVRFIAL